MRASQSNARNTYLYNCLAPIGRSILIITIHYFTRVFQHEYATIMLYSENKKNGIWFEPSLTYIQTHLNNAMLERLHGWWDQNIWISYSTINLLIFGTLLSWRNINSCIPLIPTNFFSLMISLTSLWCHASHFPHLLFVPLQGGYHTIFYIIQN